MNMIAMAVPKAGGKFERIEREIPTPGNDEILIRVQASGVCHSDALIVEGHWPGLHYPRIPGHEVLGTVEELGLNLVGWKIGARAGVGWCGGSGGHCRSTQS